jgi:hypothetical protein
MRLGREEVTCVVEERGGHKREEVTCEAEERGGDV